MVRDGKDGDRAAPDLDAREQLRRRDEFLELLSREFRNPLAAIQTAGEVLRRDDLDAAVRRQAGGIVSRQLAHLRRMLDDVLDLSRLSLGRLPTQRARVDLVQVIRDATLSCAPRIDLGHHTLQVDLPDEAAWIDGDAPRLAQAVCHLIEFAARGPEEGAAITLVARVKGASLEFVVSDDAARPDDEHLARLFEPYAANALRPEAGLGLGPAIARALIALHGGTLEAAPSTATRGIRMVARIPLPAAAVEARAATPRGPLRVLVVEDNEDARVMLAEVLRMEGYEVHEASDGAAGLAALLELRPEVALLDIGLPVLDGYELARRAREDPRGQDVLLVAVTGYGMPKDVERGWESGFDHYLVKPVQFEQLSELFETMRAEVARGGARHR